MISSPSSSEFMISPKMLPPTYEPSAKERMNRSISSIIDSSPMHLFLESKKMLPLSNSTYKPFERKPETFFTWSLHFQQPWQILLSTQHRSIRIWRTQDSLTDLTDPHQEWWFKQTSRTSNAKTTSSKENALIVASEATLHESAPLERKARLQLRPFGSPN